MEIGRSAEPRENLSFSLHFIFLHISLRLLFSIELEGVYY